MEIQCDNCGKVFEDSEILIKLEKIPNLASRLTPRGIVPFGECPECFCLVYED